MRSSVALGAQRLLRVHGGGGFATLSLELGLPLLEIGLGSIDCILHLPASGFRNILRRDPEDAWNQLLGGLGELSLHPLMLDAGSRGLPV